MANEWSLLFRCLGPYDIHKVLVGTKRWQELMNVVTRELWFLEEVLIWSIYLDFNRRPANWQFSAITSRPPRTHVPLIMHEVCERNRQLYRNWSSSSSSSSSSFIWIVIIIIIPGLNARRSPMSHLFFTRWVSQLLGLALVSWAFTVLVSIALPFAFLTWCFPFAVIWHWISIVFLLYGRRIATHSVDPSLSHF